MDYYHMKKVHDYVFSVPPGEERDKRLLEISKTDNDALYDFSMGLLSGRIQEPKTKKEEVGRLKEKCKKSQNSTRAPVNCRFHKKIV